MFFNAEAFNQPLDLDTSAVTTMYYMFSFATAFNQPLDFDTSAVTDMYSMFYRAKAFNQNLCHFGDNWPYSSVDEMFSYSGCADTNDPTSATGPWCAVTTCP